MMENQENTNSDIYHWLFKVFLLFKECEGYRLVNLRTQRDTIASQYFLSACR